MSRALAADERDACMAAIGRTLGWGLQPPGGREHDNAEALIAVIGQMRETWSGGPAPRMIAREFAARNPDTLLEAVKRLTSSAPSFPSIAAIGAVIRQVEREKREHGNDPDPDCDKCENTGWMEAPDETMGTTRQVTKGVPAHQEWDETTGAYVDVPATRDVVVEVPNVYSAMRPCTSCPRGRVVERSDAWRSRKRVDAPLIAAAQEQF